MEPRKKRHIVARVVSSERAPKAVAASALVISLLAGADNILTISLTAATLAVAEIARPRFGVRSLRTSVPRSATSQFESVAGHTP